MLSEIFLTFCVTSFIGCVLSIGALAYKSKCKEVDICCIKIVRDTAGELREDELELAKKGKTEEEIKIWKLLGTPRKTTNIFVVFWKAKILLEIKKKDRKTEKWKYW